MNFPRAATHPYCQGPDGYAPERFVVLRVLAGRGDNFEYALTQPTHPTESVNAEVVEGAWIVRCPNCPSSQYAGDTFFCTSCFNDNVDDQWLTVVWPDNADDIEDVLNKRPFTTNRNWNAGQTIDDLVAENLAHNIT